MSLSLYGSPPVKVPDTNIQERHNKRFSREFNKNPKINTGSTTTSNLYEVNFYEPTPAFKTPMKQFIVLFKEAGLQPHNLDNPDELYDVYHGFRIHAYNRHSALTNINKRELFPYQRGPKRYSTLLPLDEPVLSAYRNYPDNNVFVIDPKRPPGATFGPGQFSYYYDLYFPGMFLAYNPYYIYINSAQTDSLINKVVEIGKLFNRNFDSKTTLLLHHDTYNANPSKYGYLASPSRPHVTSMQYAEKSVGVFLNALTDVGEVYNYRNAQVAGLPTVNNP